MSSTYGTKIKLSVFGQSHSEGIGIVIDGIPAGTRIDKEALHTFMERRAPGRNDYSTKRREADEVRFLSGLIGDLTCGAPLCALIPNTDTRSQDYNNLLTVPRPSHADFSAQCKYHGFQDARGGGHFSGRLTAPLCIAGAIFTQILERRGITIGAHIASIADIQDTPFDSLYLSPEQLTAVKQSDFPVIDSDAGTKMLSVIEECRQAEDSVGGTIECCTLGLPAGIGDPMFDGIENVISSVVFAVPAVKGISFGNGFDCAKLRGSQNNDSFFKDTDGSVRTRTNHHGGILGGISSGMPLLFTVAVKPTPSIGLEQDSVNLSEGRNEKLIIHGRHDPCILPRAVPCIEAATAIALINLLD